MREREREEAKVVGVEMRFGNAIVVEWEVERGKKE